MRRMNDLIAQRDVIVLALAPSAVELGAALAEGLEAPLDVIIVKDIRAPLAPGLLLGAITESGLIVLDESLPKDGHQAEHLLRRLYDQEKAEVAALLQMYRSGRPLTSVNGKRVVLAAENADEFVRFSAAIAELRRRGAVSVLVVVQRADADVLDEIRKIADQAICLRDETVPV